MLDNLRSNLVFYYYCKKSKSYYSIFKIFSIKSNPFNNTKTTKTCPAYHYLYVFPGCLWLKVLQAKEADKYKNNNNLKDR